MTFLPVVARELAGAARKPSTYWQRTVGVGGALAVFVAVLNGRTVGDPGPQIFLALGVLLLGLCLFTGAIVTSGAIASEKENGTLGLLFLTDLKGYDIVLGKLAAHSVNAYFAVLAILPVLGLPVLMGGVTGAEFFRASLVFASTLFLSLCVGLAVSAASSDAKKALGISILAVAVCAGFLPTLWWLQRITIDVAWCDLLLWCSPAYAYRISLASHYGTRGSADFWCSVAAIWIMSGVCLAVATFLTPRVWKYREKKTSSARWPFFRPRAWKPADVEAPFLAVAGRDTGPARTAKILLLAVLPIWCCFLFLIPTGKMAGPPPAFVVCICVLSGLHIVVKTLITIEGASRLNHDRNSGALELLLTTPLRPESVIKALRTAQVGHFRLVLWILCLMNVAMQGWILIYGRSDGMDWRDQLIFAELFFGGILVLLADAAALPWTAMRNGLVRVNATKAISVTLAQVLVPCWAIIAFIVFAMQGLNGVWSAAVAFGMCFLVGVLVAAANKRAAKRALLGSFREMAERRFDKAG